MSRHVRITLEGVATCVEGGQILRTRMGGVDGPLVLISQAWPGVTVEEVTPPRTWTDGDVIVTRYPSGLSDRVRVREGARWYAPAPEARPLTDDEVDARLSDQDALGVTEVLRYQADQ